MNNLAAQRLRAKPPEPVPQINLPLTTAVTLSLRILPIMSQTLAIDRIGNNGDSQLVLRLTGPLVLTTMFDLQSQLRDAASKTTIVDLSGVPFVDSAGLGVLVNSYVSHQKNGRRLILAGVPERVMSLLRMTRVDQLFEMLPDLDTARRAAGH